MRAIKMLSEVGLDVTILKIPGAKDPDEYIKSNGAESFKKLLEGSKTKFDYNMENVLSRYDINVPQEKIKALHELEKLISETYSSAERDVYIHLVAGAMAADPKSIKQDVDRMVSAAIKKRKREESDKIKQDTIGYSDKVNPDYIKAPAAAKNEEHVLGLLLLYPEYRKLAFAEDMLGEDDFFTELNKNIFSYLKNAYLSGDESLIDINEKFSEDELGRIMRMKVARMNLSNSADVFEDAIKALRNSVRKKTSQDAPTFANLEKVLNLKRQN